MAIKLIDLSINRTECVLIEPNSPLISTVDCAATQNAFNFHYGSDFAIGDYREILSAQQIADNIR